MPGLRGPADGGRTAFGFRARFVTGYIQMNDHQHGRMLGHGFTFRARAGSGLIPRTVYSLGPNMFPLPLRVMRREPHP
jgi:hypothetical protein